MADFNILRDQFPILSRKINGNPLVFLDSAASAQKPQRVIQKMVEVMEDHYANVNRGVYTLSEEATELVESARIKVQKFINAYSADEIIFTKNATESINLVMHAWARKNLHKGDIVVLTEMEHHSNMVPWFMLRDEIGIEIKWIGVDDNGYLDFTTFKEQNSHLPIKLLCITHVSNVLGTINPLNEIISWGHEQDAKVLVDGAQGVTNVLVDVQQLDADWYVFSGHKLYGPSGVGVLYGKRELLAQMDPFLGGGDMILDVTKEGATYKEAPHKFEAGTPPIVEIVGLGEAIDFMQEIGMNAVREHNEDLIGYALSQLSSILALTVYGPRTVADKGGVVAFSLDGVHPHDIATILNDEGIAIRSGHHCAQPLCMRLGQSALARISFGVYSNRSDIDALINGLHTVISTFKD